jgi:uncharacterized DUF497 family protein
MAMEFEWYEPKRQSNLAQHKIDFQDAKEIWHGNVLEVPSSQTQHGEARFIAYGMVEGRIIAVVFTWRNGVRRLISARRARIHERKIYQDLFGEGR